MAKSRDELKEEYKDLILLNFRPEEVQPFRTKCLGFLEKYGAADCFKFLPIIDIKNDYLKKKKDAEFQHLVKVFQLFEKYAASILAKPWCKDLYTIKVYTGFFKYNFEQWLSLAIVYDVFKRIGYKETSPDTLTLETAPTNEDRALAMGFELYLAHTQLCVFKGTEYLCSMYSVESIVEGWLNTTGNVVKILEWLGKNKLTTKEESGHEDRTPSSTNIPEETPRSESVTVESQPSYYDRNGHLRIKYPPNSNVGENRETLHMQADSQGWQNEQHDYSANSGYKSLCSVDVTDNELYGPGDHAVSPLPMSESKSDCLNGRTLPISFRNKLHDEYGDNIQMTTERIRNDDLKSWENVVARGGNSKRDSSYNNENTTTIDKDILVEKERLTKMLATRVAIGEKTCKQSLLNRNSAPGKNQDDYVTLSEIYPSNNQQTEIDGAWVKYEQDFERERTDDIEPSPEPLITNTFLDSTSNFEGVDPRSSCHICGNPSAYACRTCEDIVCHECFANIFQKRPCRENKHDLYYLSSV